MSALPPGDIDAMRGKPLRRTLIARPVAPPVDTTTRRTVRFGGNLKFGDFRFGEIREAA